MSIKSPSPLKLLRALRLLFKLQSREILSSALNEGFDLSHWTKKMTEVLAPLFLDYFTSGMLRSSSMRGETLQTIQSTNSLLDLIEQNAPRRYTTSFKSISFLSGKAGRNRVVMKTVGDRTQRRIYHQGVRDAVDNHTFQFCQETNSTSSGKLQEIVSQLKELIKRGLPKQMALKTLKREVEKLFTDPVRAARIAATESRRFMFAGQVHAATVIGEMKNKKWVAQGDACEACKKLHGKVVPLNAAFTVLPGGGPYSVVLTPPLHPHCYCSIEDVP